MMGFFARLSRDHARLVVAVCLLMTIPVAAGISRIEVKAGQKDLIPTKYGTARTLAEVNERFGGINYEIPMVTSDHLLEYPMIEKFMLLEEEMKKEVGEEYYVSVQHYLTNFTYTAVAQAGQQSMGLVKDAKSLIQMGRAMGSMPSPTDPSRTVTFQELMEESVALMLSDPVGEKWITQKQGAAGLLSPDRRNAQILIKVNPDLPPSRGSEAATKFEDFFHSYFEGGEPEATVVVGGDISIDKDLENYVYTSSWFLALLAVFLLLGLLYVVFQRLTDVFFPLLVIAISAIWIYGIMGWFGLPYTVISIALGPLVLGINLGDLVYMITRFYEELGIRRDQRKASTKTIVTVGVATLIADACTIIAFASFRLSDFDVLQQFGAMAAVGVAVCFVFTVTLLPSLMVLREDRRNARGIKAPPRGVALFARDRKSRLDSFLTWVSEASQDHAVAILVIFALIIVISVLGSFRLTTTPDLRALAPQNIPALQAQYKEEKVFGGQQQDILLLTGDVLDPRALVAMHQYQEELAQSPFFSENSTSSIAELIYDAIASGQVTGIALGGGEAGSFAAGIPATREGVEEALARIREVMGPQEGFLISDDHQAALINIMGEGAKTNQEVLDRYDLLNGAAESNFGPLGVRYRLAGITPLTKDLLGNLVPTQIWTAILALILSALVLVVIFRSLTYGLITLSVLTVAVATEMGFIVFMGWKLDMMTVLIASIVIGVGIDFGIQITYRYREELEKAGGKVEEALDHTIRMVGKPIVVSVISMTGAFGVIIFSRMMPIQRFGAITALCLLVSGTASLFVIPSLLVLMAHRRAKAEARAIARAEELEAAEAGGRA
jgi:predicted RND superfamily exporter protein